MKKENALAMARYIFTTGRIVHDLVTRTYTAACMAESKDRGTGELSAQQMNMILMVRVREAVSVSELAALLGVSPPSVSAMVDRLVERGVLTRTPCQVDRRRVEIRVSTEAIEEIARVEAIVLSTFVELVEEVGPDTSQKWCDVLEHVKQVLKTRFPADRLMNYKTN
jgi:DNA-binding MarR family transcriptional regulator